MSHPMSCDENYNSLGMEDVDSNDVRKVGIIVQNLYPHCTYSSVRSQKLDWYCGDLDHPYANTRLIHIQFAYRCDESKETNLLLARDRELYSGLKATLPRRNDYTMEDWLTEYNFMNGANLDSYVRYSFDMNNFMKLQFI